MKALDSTVANIISLCLDGLVTDGGHHKQYYLETILTSLVSEKVFKIYQEQYGWEEGIAP